MFSQIWGGRGRGNSLAVMSRGFHRKFIHENFMYHQAIPKPGERSPTQDSRILSYERKPRGRVHTCDAPARLLCESPSWLCSRGTSGNDRVRQDPLGSGNKWSPDLTAYYSKDFLFTHRMYSLGLTHGSAPSCVHCDTKVTE